MFGLRLCENTDVFLPFFKFFLNQRLLHYSWDMNSANREINSIFDVNSNLKIIFLLFLVFRKEAVSKHTLSGITQVCDF